MRLLLDTNILIDVLQRREPYFRNSNAIVLACARGMAEGWVTAKSITDIHYLMHRHFHEKQPCQEVVRKLFKLFRVADTTAKACLRASLSRLPDFEDAVMVETALEIEADFIVTRNTRDYRGSAVPAKSPLEAVELLLIDSAGLPRAI